MTNKAYEKITHKIVLYVRFLGEILLLVSCLEYFWNSSSSARIDHEYKVSYLCLKKFN